MKKCKREEGRAGRGQDKKFERDPLFMDQTLVIGGERHKPREEPLK